jgi:aspartyl protease family protein
MRRCLLLTFAALPLLAAAQGLSLAGHMGSKALLMVDGQPVTLAVGERRQGVKLLALEGGAARVERNGRVSVLRVGEDPASVGDAAPPAGGREVVLSAGPGGHFLGSGSINGRAVRFMVDTGASVVAIGRDEADRIGLDYRHGRTVAIRTANGTAPARMVTLSAVKLGEVTVANVQAVVVPQAMDHVLLGNSFLRRFQMRRDNDVMRLELR